MGNWTLDFWKMDEEGNDIELTDADKKHIAEKIKEGYLSGELV